MSYSITGTHLITFHWSNVEKCHLKITSKNDKIYLQYSDILHIAAVKCYSVTGIHLVRHPEEDAKTMMNHPMEELI